MAVDIGVSEIPREQIEEQDKSSSSWPSPFASYLALSVIILGTFVNFFEVTIFGMMAERIKESFHLSDTQLGFLGGPASVIIYIFIGIPLARLADIFHRKYVLAGGVTIVGTITALGGLTQNFLQFVGTRTFVGAAGAVHAPAAYSYIADSFPPKKITRALALLQLGFIGGSTLGVFLGGTMIGYVAEWEPVHWMGLTIHNWQWLLLLVGGCGIVTGLLFLFINEPARRLPPSENQNLKTDTNTLGKIITFIGVDAARSIHTRGRVYYPLFGGLALSALYVNGLAFWQTPFFIRTYGWDEQKIAQVIAPMMLVSSLFGLVIGGALVEWIAKRHKDANVRAAALLFCCVTVCAILTPLMPSGELAAAMVCISMMFGMAGAVPQNAAIQRVAPPEMRGQVTAIYLFMFTFFGAMGSLVIGLVATRVVVNPQELWKALLICSATLLPLSTFFIYRGIKPYREEVERLEELEALAEEK